MADYVYVCWFRDLSSHPEDQDYEWPACFRITADSSEAALAWGNFLAARYCRDHDMCHFIRSYIDPEQDVESSLPRVSVGEEVSDDAIGW